MRAVARNRTLYSGKRMLQPCAPTGAKNSDNDYTSDGVMMQRVYLFYFSVFFLVLEWIDRFSK